MKWFLLNCVFNGWVELSAAVCPLVLRSGEEVLWCRIRWLHAYYTWILVGLLPFSCLSHFCSVAFVWYSLNERINCWLTLGCVSSPGFTAGWTTLSYVRSRGWYKRAWRTSLCMKELFWTQQTNQKQKHRQARPDVPCWLKLLSFLREDVRLMSG